MELAFRQRLVFMLAVGLTGACVAAVPAEAGTYTVHACQRPDLKAAGFDGWRRTFVGAESEDANYCARAGSRLLFMRALAPHPPGDSNQLTFAAPPDTTIYGYSVWRSARLWTTSRFDYRYTLTHGAPSQVIETCSGKAGCAGVGDPDKGIGDANLFWQLGLRGVRNVSFSLACAGSATCDALTTDSPAKLRIHRADMYLEEFVPPVITRLGGALADARGPVTGDQSVSISATDVGSGVAEAIAEIDGREMARGTLDVNGGECQEPYTFTSTVPCKLSVKGALGIDTSGLPDGMHTLRVRVADATRANITTSDPITFRTANGCRQDTVSASLRMRATVDVRRGRRVRHRRSATLPYRGRTTLRGGLRTAAGAPVAGAVVCVVARQDIPGAELTGHAWVQTDSQGRFAYRLPRGVSRTVYAVHAGADGAAAASVKVRVRPSVRLRAPRRRLRNGDVLPLRGRVKGGPVPRRGTLVELQAWRESDRGSYWQTFGTTRTRRRGGFTFYYSLARTTGTQRYLMRAKAPHQAGYPYAAGASRRVVVRVTG